MVLSQPFNIALKLAYDGSSFWGWQKNHQAPTVEGSLKLCLEQILQETVHLQAASRTDRGVHADEQWVNFICKKKLIPMELRNSLNALLPCTMRVLEVHEMPLHFHPTLHALKKEYDYQVCFDPILLPKERDFYWHVPYPLDLEKIKKASHFFIGLHDFSSFCNQRKNLNYKDKNRQIESINITQPKENYVLMTIIGTHFLYKMVRNIVGTLIYVGRGKIELECIPAILKTGQRSMAGMTAPARGLTLKRIYYPQEFHLEI